MATRFIAQRALTGKFLHWDLPLTEDRYTRELSGPGTIEGTLEPEMTTQLAEDGLPIVIEWDTALYVEVDGQIRAGGLITNLEWEGPKLSVTAAGFATYPTGIPYMGEYTPSLFPDPATVIKDLWAYVQDQPDGDLGVTVVGDKTWMRVGSGEGGPYRMYWHEIRDCGEEINSLLATGPMDYVERHAWNEHQTDITHTIELGFPRIGRRRHDLRFADGENIAALVPFASDGLEYAQDVYGFGEGEGGAMVRGRVAVPNGRLRRCATYFDKSADKQRLMVALRAEAVRRGNSRDLRELTIHEHPNAPIGSINPGDDILVQSDTPWLGSTRTWVRVLSIEETTATADQAVLTVQRADSFRYAPGDSPTGRPVPLDLGQTYGDVQ